MDEKIQNATKYLSGCLTLEEEVARLYVTATKKLPYPFSIVTTAIAYDNQKHAAVLRELLKPVLQIHLSLNELSKEFKISICEINRLLNDLLVKESIEREKISDFLKSLTDTEDCLLNFYSNFIDSKLIKEYFNAIPETSNLTFENLLYILQALKQDNSNHRDMLIENRYFHNKNEQQNSTAPIVRYQNPNAWVQA
jgi:hypothetical protein